MPSKKSLQNVFLWSATKRNTTDCAAEPQIASRLLSKSLIAVSTRFLLESRDYGRITTGKSCTGESCFKNPGLYTALKSAVRSEAAHADAEAQSAKSFLAVSNRPNLVLQTLGKLASRWQTLDRELKFRALSVGCSACGGGSPEC